MIRHLSPNLTWRPSLLQRAKKSLILLARRLGLPIALLLCSLPLQGQTTTKRLDSAAETYAAGNFATLIGGVGNAAGANLCNTDGRFCTFTFDATSALRVAASFSPPALQNVNLTQVGSVVLSGANVVDAGNTAFRVNCVTGCVAGGSFADATAFTFGTTPVSNTAFVVDDVATNTVAENSAGAGRMSTNRIPYFSLHTAAGVEVPFPSALIGGSFKTIDSTLANVFTNAGTLNVSLWDATGAEQKGQKTMANSIPVTIASNQSALSVTATNSFLLDATFTGRINTQGQKAMAASTPVVIASDQSAVPVSGTVSVSGVSTLAEQQTQTTALQLIDNLPLAQDAATAGQSGVLAQGAVTTAQPTYTTANTNPLSLSTRGGLRTEGAWPTCPADSTAIDAGSSIRCKIWNSAGCGSSSAVGDCEEYKGLLRLKGRRKSDLGTEIVISKVITDDNDRSASGTASGGASWPFGAAAGRGRTVTDADSPGANCALTSITTGEVVTSCAHGFATNTQIVLNIVGSDALSNGVSINGPHQVTITGATTYTLDDVDVTTAGTAVGNHYGSRILTSATAAFTAGDVGKNITLSTGGVICTTADAPCQGPKFPIGTLYQGTIVGFTNATTVTVLPTIHVDPAGTATLKIEPVLLGDDDATEVGDFCLKGVDLNYWESEKVVSGTSPGIRVGQTYYECEINKNPASAGSTFNMHDGWTLFSDYQETSYHLSWTSGSTVVKRHKVGDTHGWTHEVVVTSPAAGADWTMTVPTNAHYKILNIRATLVTDGTASNRVPGLIVDDGTANLSWVATPPAAQRASLTNTYSFTPGATPMALLEPLQGNGQQWINLPIGLELTEGGRVRVVTGGIQATDQWSAIVFTVEEWIEE